jgi:hypothetical protein
MSRSNSGGNAAASSNSRQQQFRQQTKDDANLSTWEVLERVGQILGEQQDLKTTPRRLSHEPQRRSSSSSLSTKSKMQMAESAFKAIGGPSRRASESSLESATASVHHHHHHHAGENNKKVFPFPIRSENKKQMERKPAEKKQQVEKKQAEKKQSEKRKSKAASSPLSSSKPPSRFRRHQPDSVEQTESNKQEFRRSLLSALAEDKGKSRRRSQSRGRRSSRSRSRVRSRDSISVKPLPSVALPPANSVESILLTSRNCPIRSSITIEDGTAMRRRNCVNWSEEIHTKELEKDRKLKFLDRELQKAKLKLVEVPKALLPQFSQQERRNTKPPGGAAA